MDFCPVSRQENCGMVLLQCPLCTFQRTKFSPFNIDFQVVWYRYFFPCN